jgi:ribosomal-protein-alanine N-acetyltransferase
MTWQLRAATSADLDGIMALEDSIFEADAWSRDSMLGELSSEHTRYLVAHRPDSATLDAYAGMLMPRGSTEADIQTIAVAPAARRSGLGRTLMLQLIHDARQAGVRELFLEVRADNPPAQALYESLGFERIGVRTGYYQPDNVDAIVMRLSIPDARTMPTIGGGA